jgi:hypothetical protein
VSKRAAIGLVALLWLLEWVFGWTQHLGKLGEGISLIWLTLLGYFVVETRHRLPRAVHTWGWMFALLVVSVVRAWWIGTDGLGLFSELVKQLPQSGHHLTKDDVEMMDALFDVMISGVVVGIAGALEALIIAVTSWFADRFRTDRQPPRVDLLSRLVVFVLQVPIFLVLMGTGFAAIGGATVLATHGIPANQAGVGDFVPWIAGFGLAGWVLATFHLERLYALANGSAINRLVLAVFAIAAAGGAIALGAHSVKGIAVLVVWVAAQLLTLRFASPTSTPAPAARRVT